LKGDLNPHTKLDKASRYLNLFECVKPALLTFMKANMREIITNKISAVLILDTLDVNGKFIFWILGGVRRKQRGVFRGTLRVLVRGTFLACSVNHWTCSIKL